MEWTYDVTTGWLTDPAGERLGRGYSGRAGPCRDNVAFERVRNCGPIPRGLYRMLRHRHGRLGRYTIPLEPVAHDAHFRSAFLVHGDNATQDASEGCIILGPALRFLLAGSEHRFLRVTGYQNAASTSEKVVPIR